MELRTKYQLPILKVLPQDFTPGQVAWTSPSNIALIKYWGKHGVQLPQNPSLSFTLNKALSRLTLSYEARSNLSTPFDLTFTYNGEEKPAFKERIEGFFKSVEDLFPFLRFLKIRIESSNTFPHSSGIASSASSMSALALCLCSVEDIVF